jgi:hypothetical protein
MTYNAGLSKKPIEARPAGAPEQLWKWAKRRPALATLVALAIALSSAACLWYLRVKEHEKIARATQALASLHQNEKTQSHTRLGHTLLVSLLTDQLNDLWLRSDRSMLRISSEQLAALSGRPIHPAGDKSSIERYSFGLISKGDVSSEAQAYANFLSHLELGLTKHRKRPVRIDVTIFKFEEDYREALRTNGVITLPFNLD